MVSGLKRWRGAGLWALAAAGVCGVALAVSAGLQQAQAQQDTQNKAAAWTQAGPVVAAVPTSPADPFPLEYPRWHTLENGEYQGYNQRASLIQRGHEVYLKYCVGCHGEFGDGHGVAAPRLITQPRDFTSGIYKFRSTDSGSLPLETDLYRTIKRGLARVSMPAFPLMPEREVVAVVEYIKTFYPRWDQEKDRRAIVPVALAPTDLNDATRIHRGRIVYTAMNCGKCHGTDGAGQGATQTEYVDAWGNKQRPFNFTRGRLKGGDDPEDIYRTFHTGLRSIMPAYDNATLVTVAADTFETNKQMLADGEFQKLQPYLKDFPASAADVFTKLSDSDKAQLGERNSWDLVAYVMSLRQAGSTAPAMFGNAAVSTPAAPAADSK